jgi:threonyl-tRNA synthetase
VLVEHYAGAFPTWLAPVQVRVLPVATPHEEYAREVVERLQAAGARVDMVAADDGLGKRIRNGKIEKLPYVLVVGDDDVAARSVGVNARTDLIGDGGEVERDVPLDDFVTRFETEIADAESAALSA